MYPTAADWMGLLYGPGSVSNALDTVHAYVRECKSLNRPHLEGEAFGVLALERHLGLLNDRLAGLWAEVSEFAGVVCDEALEAKGV